MTASLGRLALVACSYFVPSSGQSGSYPRPAVGEFNVDLSSGFGIPQPTINGTQSFIRFQNPPPVLLKRDCLANGTNYCFGDNANYCASCGTCCSADSGKWCCPSDGVCCGSACCASGQTCNNGQCFLPIQTVTSSSVVMTTVTHQATVTDTVVEIVYQTSTINSVVETTVTGEAATETDWTYVTATAFEKRWVHSVSAPKLPPKAKTQDESADSLREACDEGYEELSSIRAPDAEQATLLRRQQTGAAAPATVAATTTVTEVVTQTSDYTNVIHETTTTDSTSMALTTIYQTNTRVLNAKATVQATSTVTFTSRPPVTSTITHIATLPASATTTPAAPSSSGSLVPPLTAGSPPGLSTPAIVGVAVGSTAFAILSCLVIFALVKYRQRKARLAAQYEDTYLGLGGHDTYEPGRGYGVRQASLPPQFGPVAPAHHRTTSAFTGSSLVATAAAAGAGADAAQAKLNRASAVSSSNYSTGPYPFVPVEVSADEVQRYEVDGNSPHHSLSPGSTPAVESPAWLGGVNPNPPPPQNGFYRDF